MTRTAGPRDVVLPREVGAVVVIGRADSSDVAVRHGSVSRRHVEVVRQPDGSWELRDVSRNGTWSGGARVSRLRITDDVLVHLGEADGPAVRLQVPAPAAQDTAVQPVATPVGARGLVVRGLGVRRGDRDLLSDVDVTLAPGELVAVLGPSGAGKSTFVRTVTGGQRPTAGQVLLDGLDVHAHPEAVRDLVGFVPQEDVLHTALTVRQCLEYSAAVRLPEHVGAAERAAAVDRVVAQLGLSGREDTRISSLSGGQRKRVGTALELLSEPSLLVLDEPTSGLDPHTERQVMALLADLAAAGHTVLVVTHSPVAIAACERAVVVARGRLVYAGPTASLPEHFAARSLGTVFARVGDDEQGAYAEQWRQVVAGLAEPEPPVPQPAPPPRPVTARTWWRQARTCARRDLALLLADRGNLALLLLGAPLLGLLVRPLDEGGLRATGTPDPSALNVLLALVLCVVWVGTFDAVREVVKERAVLDRERRAGLSASAYVTGKLAVLGTLVVVQVAALVAALLAGRPAPVSQLLPGPGVELAAGLAVVGLASVAVALLVSALATSSDKALAVSPLLVVPQLVLAGALMDVHGSPVLDAVTRLVAARWGLSAAASSTDLGAQTGVPQPAEWSASASSWLGDVAGAAGLGAVALVALLLVLRRQGPRTRGPRTQGPRAQGPRAQGLRRQAARRAG